MKFLSHIKYPYSARYYDYTTGNSGGEPTYDYFYSHDIHFAGGVASSRLVFYAKDLLRLNAQLNTVSSIDGTLVMPDELYPEEGTTYRITTVEPVLNAFGRREMYKYRAAAVG